MAIKLVVAVIISSILANLLVIKEVAGQYTWMTPYDTSSFTDWDKVLKNVPSTCSLKHVHFLARHGSRTPSSDQIDAATAVVTNVNKFLPTWSAASGSPERKKVENLASWKAHFPNGGQTLLPRGVEEHQFLSEDYFRLFAKYNLTGMLLSSSTNQSRTITSSKVFQDRWKNLTAESKRPFTFFPNFVDDERLSFFSKCYRYVNEIKNNASTRPEFTQMASSPEGKKLVKEFNERLFGQSATTSYSLTFDDIFALYYMAGLEIMSNGSSDLSQFFTDSDLEFFDYADDVETWWKSAYGYKLNIEPTCALLKYIFGLAPVSRYRRGGLVAGFAGVFQFTHSEAMVPLFSFFGLFNDTKPLTGTASREFIKNRVFKGSKITPFATNMALLYFDCTPPNTADADSNADQYHHMAIIVNGKLQRLPNVCPDSDTCSVPKILAAFSSVISCNQEQICAPRSATGQAIMSSAVRPLSTASSVFLSGFATVWLVLMNKMEKF